MCDKVSKYLEPFDIVLLIEGKRIERIFKEVWEKITKMYNNTLHFPKESSPFVNRELEMLIHRFTEKLMPLRTELEGVIEIISEKNNKLMRKF